MKASQYIKELQKLIDEYGDLPIGHYLDYSNCHYASPWIAKSMTFHSSDENGNAVEKKQRCFLT